jgi:hypothetical protein
MLCFPLVALLGLKFKSSIHSLSSFNHFNAIEIKMVLHESGTNHVFYRLAITKHRTSNGNHILQKG